MHIADWHFWGVSVSLDCKCKCREADKARLKGNLDLLPSEQQHIPQQGERIPYQSFYYFHQNRAVATARKMSAFCMCKESNILDKAQKTSGDAQKKPVNRF